MKISVTLILSFLLAAPVMAASDAARVAGDLKVGGIHFAKDGSTMDSANDLLRNRGSWQSSELYSAGDVVQYQGASYVCTAANISVTPPNAACWSVLGAQGGGLNSLIKLSSEPFGVNCASGGITVNSGLDANRSGVLDAAEITTTMYVCNGVNGNTPPVANANIDQSVAIGALVTLDGNNSNDPDSNPITYSWSISSKPAGSSAVLSNGAVANPTFTADIAGSYVFSLIVNDGKVSSSPSTVTITAEASESITLVLAAAPGNPYQVNGTATFSKAAPNVPIKFYWKMISINDPTGTQPGNFGSSGDISTNALGVATYTLNVFQANVEMSLQVEAKSGNVSSGVKVVSIPAQLTSSINTAISTPLALSTVSFSGVSDPIICAIDLHLTYPTGTTYVNGVTSGEAPVGTSLVPINIRQSDADITIIGANGFGSGEIAKISYGTVPSGSISANFGVTILKVFNCDGIQIQ